MARPSLADAGRRHAAQLATAVRASFEPGEFTLTDEQIVGAIGWALTVSTAATKVRGALDGQGAHVLR